MPVKRRAASHTFRVAADRRGRATAQKKNTDDVKEWVWVGIAVAIGVAIIIDPDTETHAQTAKKSPKAD